jgi:sugar (pentulose or hexulose) kinase
VHNVKEAGCYGAATLAQSAVEKVPAEQLLNSRKTEDEIFTPNPVNAKIYDHKFETYKQMYPALRQFWKA